MANDIFLELGVGINESDKTKVKSEIKELSKKMNIEVGFATNIDNDISKLLRKIKDLNSELAKTGNHVGVGNNKAGGRRDISRRTGEDRFAAPYGSYGSISNSLAPQYSHSKNVQADKNILSLQQTRNAKKAQNIKALAKIDNDAFIAEKGTAAVKTMRMKEKEKLEKEAARENVQALKQELKDLRTAKTEKATEKRKRMASKKKYHSIESAEAYQRELASKKKYHSVDEEHGSYGPAAQRRMSILRERIMGNKNNALGWLSIAGAAGGRSGMIGAGLGQAIGGWKRGDPNKMNEKQLLKYNERITKGRSRGLKYGAFAGISTHYALSAAGLGVRATMAGSRAARGELDDVAAYQKQLRLLKNVTNSDPSTKVKKSDMDITRMGDNISKMAVKYGTGTISEYMEVYRDAVGKGMTDATAKAFMRVGSQTAVGTGASVEGVYNSLFSMVTADRERYVEMGMVKKGTGTLQINGKKGEQMLLGESLRINALAASGGFEWQDIQSKVGEISSMASLGGQNPMEVVAMLEAISPLMPNTNTSMTSIKNLLKQSGDVKKQNAFIRRLNGDKKYEIGGKEFTYTNSGMQDVASDLIEKQKTGKGISVIDMLKSLSKLSKNKGFMKKTGMNEEAMMKMAFGSQFREIRAMKGGMSLFKQMDKYEELMKIVKEENIDKLGKFSAGTFDLDLSMQSAKSMWRYKSNQYGGVAAPYISAMLQRATGSTDTYSNEQLKTMSDTFIDDAYKGDENIKTRENLKMFASSVASLTEKFEKGFLDKLTDGTLIKPLVISFEYFASMMMGIAEGIGSILGVFMNNSAEQKEEDARAMTSGLSSVMWGSDSSVSADGRTRLKSLMGSGMSRRDANQKILYDRRWAVESSWLGATSKEDADKKIDEEYAKEGSPLHYFKPEAIDKIKEGGEWREIKAFQNSFSIVKTKEDYYAQQELNRQNRVNELNGATKTTTPETKTPETKALEAEAAKKQLEAGDKNLKAAELNAKGQTITINITDFMGGLHKFVQNQDTDKLATNKE